MAARAKPTTCNAFTYWCFADARLDGSSGAQDEPDLTDFEMKVGGPAEAKARKIVAYLEELGFDSADTFSGTLGIAELAPQEALGLRPLVWCRTIASGKKKPTHV